MKTYVATDGFRDPETKGCVVVREDGVVRTLKHYVLHSPDGFAWGYAGSGPTELARCILWDLLDEEPPTGLYAAFRAAFLEGLPQDRGWELGSDAIKAWLLSAQPEYWRDWLLRQQGAEVP